MKKRTTLRDKSAKASSKQNLSNKISELQTGGSNDETYHENPFLKLSKISKKDKQTEKSNTFVKKVQVGANTTGGISKSSLRRRKRKEKEELKPKMNELLTSLDEPLTITKIVERKPTGFVQSSKLNLNQPNAAKRTGHSKILSKENKNFQKVLQNPQFRTSPFAALKDAIAQNLQK